MRRSVVRNAPSSSLVLEICCIDVKQFPDLLNAQKKPLCFDYRSTLSGSVFQEESINVGFSEKNYKMQRVHSKCNMATLLVPRFLPNISIP